MASPTARASIGGQLGAVLVSVAAALVILGVSIVPFLTPAWIHGEQARAGMAVGDLPPATAWAATDSIVHDLVFGGDFKYPSGFFCSAGCPPVLDAREVAHMNDVRGVFQALAVLVAAGIAVLTAGVWLSRANGDARRGLWRAIGRGARWLAVLMAAIGVLSIVAFDAAFQVFHELLFPAGSFSFDPATERLVQLFPDQFWSDTALALGVVALVLSLGVAWLAGRRAARPTAEPAVASGAPGPSSLTPRSVR